VESFSKLVGKEEEVEEGIGIGESIYFGFQKCVSLKKYMIVKALQIP